MSGLVTLLSERLETIARLWDAGLPTWAYVTVTVRRSGLTADQFMGTRAFFRLARQEKKKENRISSVPFICSNMHFPRHLCSAISDFIPSPSLDKPSTLTLFATHFFCYHCSCRSTADVDNCRWSSRWRLCPAHLCHHSGLPLLQAHRQRWAQRLVWAGGSTANSSNRT